MSRDDIIEAHGKVIDIVKGGKFRVDLENGHTVAEDAAVIAKKANVEQLILTHLSNRYTSSKPLLDEAKTIFENTVYAEDLMVVIIENKKPVQINFKK